jgi:hypothetical protein
MEWFASKGAHVLVPFGHSPDYDFVAELGERLLKVQVKTCIAFRKNVGPCVSAREGATRAGTAW